MAQIARAIRRVHHFHRGEETRASTADPRLPAATILDVRHIFLEHVQLATLLLIADEDSCAVGKFSRRVNRRDRFSYGAKMTSIFRVLPG